MVKQSPLTNFSMASIESGIFDMDEVEGASELKMNIGETIVAILAEAQKENRLICGLNNALQHLKETDCPEHSLFFLVAPSAADSLAHMQEVVLQSFCFENDIYIIKLDSAEKLKSILGLDNTVTCALVQRLTHHGKKEKYTKLETNLIDHCEDFWDELIQPIIKLPEKWIKWWRKSDEKLMNFQTEFS